MPIRKISPEQVQEIKDLRKSGESGMKEIAAAYGISLCYAYQLVRGSGRKKAITPVSTGGALPNDVEIFFRTKIRDAEEQIRETKKQIQEWERLYEVAKNLARNS